MAISWPDKVNINIVFNIRPPCKACFGTLVRGLETCHSVFLFSQGLLGRVLRFAYFGCALFSELVVMGRFDMGQIFRLTHL